MSGLVVAGLLPFAGALVLNGIAQPRSLRAGVFASAIVVAVFALIASATPGFLEHPGYARFSWIPQLGVSFSMLADGLSMLFALIIAGIGVIVFTYATAYLGPDEKRRRFFCYLLLFMGAMLGVVLSANLIALFVFWEMTSVSSFLLIGYWHEREPSRAGALKALVVTSSGGLAMLVGFVMIGSACGTYEIPEIVARRALLAASPWATPAAVLVMLGAITKSAQMPFHLWLPSAMEAPTPVSAYLHAATMVKAGLYLVARLAPVLSPIEIWTPTLTTIGLVTMAWGSFMALRQSDLKGLLAFSTVSKLGLIMSLLATGSSEGMSEGLLHLLNHACFKGALFLLVGIIEHETHTRDVMKLGPLARQMPRTWFLLAVGALSMAGMPPLGGFVSKELFLEHTLHLGTAAAAVAIAGSALTAGYCFALAVGLALARTGRDHASAHPPHDPGIALLWGPALLILLTVALGLAPQTLAGHLVGSAAAAATAAAEPTHLHLALWHGLTPALADSLTALGTGALIYAFGWSRRAPSAPRLLSDRVYDASLKGLESGARALTAAYMSGLLWRYNAVVLGVLLAALGAVIVATGMPPDVEWPTRQPLIVDYITILVTGVAAVATVVARTRLAAILALGASGYGLALVFVELGAPDLALTQVMVETAATVLFLAVFVVLPPYRPHLERGARPVHLLLSAGISLMLVRILSAALGSRVAPSISEYFVEKSLPEAGGHNIVNVIIVDFRGLDTLGEISVLTVAGLACFAVVKLARARTARSA
ncbi:MAG: DUF4040 domain-containing protein [Myxococcales bacterium]|nr:MAG: DUF4040 domain-containing protein [Myxococcales bacterium]